MLSRSRLDSCFSLSSPSLFSWRRFLSKLQLVELSLCFVLAEFDVDEDDDADVGVVVVDRFSGRSLDFFVSVWVTISKYFH